MGIIDESNADVFAMALNDTDTMPGVEAATYNRFGNTNGVSINPQVNRHPVEEPSEVARGRTYRITCFIGANTNITSINPAGDTITLAATYGGATSNLAVVDVLEQSPAGWLLLLR